jgi:hypothetical protein
MFKKIILGTVVAGLLSTNLFSMDITSSEGQSSKEDTDKSIAVKESEENRNSKSNRKSWTDAVELSKSKNTTVTRASQTDIFENLEELERIDKENLKKGKTKELGFFGRCSVISNPKLPKNFGIVNKTSDNGEDFMDSNLSTYWDSAGKSNVELRTVPFLKKQNEIDLKEYMNCLLKYGSIGAQSLINGSFTLEITDPEILSMNKSAERNLKNPENYCNFVKTTDLIQCRSLKISIDYEPILQDKQITYFSKDNFLGVSGTEQYSTNENSSKREELAKSLEKAYNFSESKDGIRTKKISDTQDNSVKTDVSAKTFFTGLFK